MNKRPSILVIAGFDPTGGAGIQADIETINDHGCHACSLITALTQQNSSNLLAYEPVSSDLVYRQFCSLHQEIEFSAVKIGMIGSIDMLETIVRIIENLVNVPVVLDPVLAAGGGASVANAEFIDLMKDKLLRFCTIITPNIPEAQKLSGKTGLNDCASTLLEAGSEHVLITGTHQDQEIVVNTLFSKHQPKYSLSCERLTAEYHGSGCTFASALTAGLALNHSAGNAFRMAHDYTFNSLKQADQPGKGQFFPRRQKSSFDA